jgi:hypothetical protein
MKNLKFKQVIAFGLRYLAMACDDLCVVKMKQEINSYMGNTGR